jgi:hypothetical protein
VLIALSLEPRARSDGGYLKMMVRA